MSKREGISKKLRFEVFKRDSFKCQYCGASAPEVILHVDHIHPVAEDGTTDMMNLITSCIDCNLGKGARKLSDDSVLKKQKAQLDELQLRRQQIEWMAQWREDLSKQHKQTYDYCIRELLRYIPEDKFSKAGITELKISSKKYPFSILLDAIEFCVQEYLKYEDGYVIYESSHKCLMMIQKVADLINRCLDPKCGTQSYHLMNILKVRMRGATKNDLETAREELYQILFGGANFSILRRYIEQVNNWNDYAEVFNHYQ